MTDQQIVAPRITRADIEANIVAEYFFTAAHGVLGAKARGELIVRNPAEVSRSGAEMLTFCVLQLRNGFTVTGESACASPEIARDNAVAKIWPLMGYELRSKLAAA